VAATLAPEEREQKDDGQWNSENPQQQPATKTHVCLLQPTLNFTETVSSDPCPPREASVPGYLAKRTSRMMIGMGIPMSHKRIGIAFFLSFEG
jgi:hypothetical protein